MAAMTATAAIAAMAPMAPTALPSTPSVSSTTKAEPTGQKTGDRPSVAQSSHLVPTERNASQQSSSAAPASESVTVSARPVTEEALPILPTGIVANTDEVYREVASYDTVPLEKIQEYWHVYTITHKKLFHPTANRLENFWWHVWGSQRRNLSGKTVARLYKEISTGPTFVPLHTPATRYDGPTIPNFASTRTLVLKEQESIPGSSKADAEASQGADDSTDGVQDTEPESRRQVPASSSTRAPAQSIMRKTRPSLSGPRPTPRFDLPSEDDLSSGKEMEEASQAGPTGQTDKDNSSDAAGNNDATAGSVGRGSTSTSTSASTVKTKTNPDSGEGSAPKPSSSASSSSKTAASKQPEPRKPAKPKPTKKKFVVSATSSSKKRPLIARRPVSHSSQGSHSSVGSEGPSSRGAATSHPSRHAVGPEITEEDEAVHGHVEMDDLMITAVSAPTESRPEHQQPPPPHQHSSVQTTHTYRSSPLSSKAAGKQPVRPSLASPMERTLSQASESTAISSMSGSTVASVATGGAPADAAVAMGPVSGAVSVSGPTAPAARVESSPVISSVGTSILEMPMVSRDRRTMAQLPSPGIPGTPGTPGTHGSSSMRPGVGLVRQSTMPSERGPMQRQEMMRTGSMTSLARMKSPVGAPRPSSAYMGQISTAAPSTPPPTTTSMTSMTAFAAPLMGRSISQDSYGYRPRLLGQNHPSPTLAPMRSATVVAPSMIAANGQFMDPEGPDTFSFYAKTGLDDEGKDDDDDDDQELASSFKGEASSSFGSGTHDPPAMQRPLFTPTRPTQTPRIPFARTRSQLNVILDREKERLGKGNYNSWNESRSSGRDHDSQRRGS